MNLKLRTNERQTWIKTLRKLRLFVYYHKIGVGDRMESQDEAKIVFTHKFIIIFLMGGTN